jgi:hypothetical protein
MFNFFKKTISHKGKKYTRNDLDRLMDKWMDENFNPPGLEEIDKFAVKSLELTESQLESIKQDKLYKRASSWKSRQRRLRKEGKLTQSQINKLNELGMVWNPTEDPWEKCYSYYRNKGLLDPIEDWAKEQLSQFKKNELPEENMVRLKAANFPFNEISGLTFKLDYYQIMGMIEQLGEGEKIYRDKFLKEKSKNIKSEDVVLTKAQKKKIDELTQMTFEDFKLEIDNLFNREYKIDESQGFIKSKQEHYADSYFDAFMYLNGKFFDDSDEVVKYKCSDDVQVYAAEKSLSHLDKYMLGSGDYNDARGFPPVNKLITYYSKNKMIDDLLRVNKVIQKYPVLKAIYSERVNKILTKYNKI